jgi:hypothetical protein
MSAKYYGIYGGHWHIQYNCSSAEKHSESDQTICIHTEKQFFYLVHDVTNNHY